MKHNQQLGFSLLKIFPWLLVLIMGSLFFWVVQNPKQNGDALQSYLPESMHLNQQTQNEQPSEATTPNTPALFDVAPSTTTSAPAVSSYHDAVTLASQSVVNIYTTQKVQNPYANDPVLSQLFEYYGQKQQKDVSSLGSGVIVSKDGYIITNAHVIEKADEVIVALNDGRKANAKIIGQDTESDLAVIKIELDNITPIAFRTDPIRVGDVALAIGNPFGVGQTVTQGIISATGRAGLGVSSFEDFIQTDAAINPGNSGGALVDANGALIGINTMIYTRSGGSVGIGFAIPNSIVKQVMTGLIENGKVSRGWLGIEIAQHQNSDLDLTEHKGVEITYVGQNTPAQNAGLQAGDVVLSIDGTATNEPNTLIGLVSTKAPDSKLSMVILRNGEKQNITVTIGERPTTQSQKSTNLSPEELAQLQELLEQMQRFHRR